MKETSQPTLRYLFFTFLKIGATSWGGFMALISVVQKKVVEKDQAITNEQLLEGISLASVLPGPVAFNVVTYIGYKLRGIKGAFVSMAGIVLPSFLLMILLSVLYIRYGNIPSFGYFFAGILPAVAAIILSVAYNMARKNISDPYQIVIALVSAIVIAISKAYISSILILIVSAVAGFMLYYKHGEIHRGEDSIPASPEKSIFLHLLIPGFVALALLIVLLLPTLMPATFAEPARLQRRIMLTFSGLSISLFGGGYVIIPAMQQVIVNSLGWLTSREFTDAVAMGQVTPGPIFISATFVGYKVAGVWGAINATLSIFLPPGLLMIFCSRFFNSIRNSPVTVAIFKGLRPAIIGMIAAAAYTILAGSDLSLKTGLLFLFFLTLASRYKTDPVYLIPGAGLIGLLIF